MLHLVLQVAVVARSTFKQLHLERRLQPFTSGSNPATFVHAVVTTTLAYCSALYVGLPLTIVQKLQLLRNMVAHLLMEIGCPKHITPVLQSMHWFLIGFLAKFKGAGFDLKGFIKWFRH